MFRERRLLKRKKLLSLLLFLVCSCCVSFRGEFVELFGVVTEEKKNEHFLQHFASLSLFLFFLSLPIYLPTCYYAFSPCSSYSCSFILRERRGFSGTPTPALAYRRERRSDSCGSEPRLRWRLSFRAYHHFLRGQSLGGRAVFALFLCR